MDKLKRFIDVYVPVTSCTLRCEYCYITHNRLFSAGLPEFKYDVETVRKGLSKERFGGVCLFNFCGGGETLLPPEMPKYIRAVLEEGHYVSVVTNATVDRAFDEFAAFPPELLERLFFKFSYHYTQLKQRNLLDRFFANIKKVVDAGASFTLEATPSDEWIPYIEEMKERALKEVGALPHISVARDEHDMGEIPILTKMSREEYYNFWMSSFDSKLFDFKMSVFNKKRNEFCYAGDWVNMLDLGTGELSNCNCHLHSQNIFNNPQDPIRFCAIGHHCQLPHCFNAHVWMTFGCIPEMDTPSYTDMRNRTRADGSEWLKPTVKTAFSQKLKDSNKEYGSIKKLSTDLSMDYVILRRKAATAKRLIKAKLGK